MIGERLDVGDVVLQDAIKHDTPAAGSLGRLQVSHLARPRPSGDPKDGNLLLLGKPANPPDEAVGEVFEDRVHDRSASPDLSWTRRQTLHIVIDNASYHLKAEVIAYAKANRIRFYFAPTGASWLNRIECHFTAMRKFVFDNTDYRTHEEQGASIKQYLAWRNRRRAISLKDWKRHKRQTKRAA